MIYGASYYVSIEQLTPGKRLEAIFRGACPGLAENVAHPNPPTHPPTPQPLPAALADCLHSTGVSAVVVAENGTEYNVFPEYFVEAPTLVRVLPPAAPLPSPPPRAHAFRCNGLVCNGPGGRRSTRDGAWVSAFAAHPLDAGLFCVAVLWAGRASLWCPRSSSGMEPTTPCSDTAAASATRARACLCTRLRIPWGPGPTSR
jgi:hypothetical protein